MEQPSQLGFKPPPYSEPQQPMREQVTVVSVAFGKDPQHMKCPYCHTNISTRVENSANVKTHLMAIIFFLLGCWCCIPCPYFIDSCMGQKHYCPTCNSYLGSSD